MKDTYICTRPMPDGSVCGQEHLAKKMHDHNQWHKREERRYRAKQRSAMVTAPIKRVEDVTVGEVVRSLELAQLYMDRGFFSAIDRVATDLTKETGVKWTRKSVLHFLAGGGVPVEAGDSGSR